MISPYPDWKWYPWEKENVLRFLNEATRITQTWQDRLLYLAMRIDNLDDSVRELNNFTKEDAMELAEAISNYLSDITEEASELQKKLDNVMTYSLHPKTGDAPPVF